MFNGKKLGAQRYKDKSKAANSEGTNTVKNQFGPWNSIQGHTSEKGCQGDTGLSKGRYSMASLPMNPSLEAQTTFSSESAGPVMVRSSIGIQAARASAVAMVRHGAYRSEKFSLLARAASRRGRRPG